MSPKMPGSKRHGENAIAVVSVRAGFFMSVVLKANILKDSTWDPMVAGLGE